MKNKAVFKKHLSKEDYKIARMRWELNKNSEEIAKELNLKTQEVYMMLSKFNTQIKKGIQINK